MIGLSIQNNALQRINIYINRMSVECKKSDKNAISWAAATFIVSLAARTRVSKKKRDIVPNPIFKENPEKRKDMRLARFGVMKYRRKKDPKHYFSPIYKGGEYGQKIKYLNKGSVLLKMPDGTWNKYKNGEITDIGFGGLTIQNHPKRVIGRSGLAKASWGFLNKLRNSGGTAYALGVNNVGSIVWSHGNNQMTITNKLDYIRNAISGKMGAINAAFNAAANSLETKLKEKLVKLTA